MLDLGLFTAVKLRRVARIRTARDNCTPHSHCRFSQKGGSDVVVSLGRTRDVLGVGPGRTMARLSDCSILRWNIMWLHILGNTLRTTPAHKFNIA